MRELLEVWRNTRLVVQVAVTAGLYAAVLIPFKAIAIIIPGVTEVRPANAIPIVCALLFGPAAAWGSAFGNLIGDFFGTLGPGSIFGFIGNFLYAYVPYRLWGVHRLARRDTELVMSKRLWLVLYPLVAAVAIIAVKLVGGYLIRRGLVGLDYESFRVAHSVCAVGVGVIWVILLLVMRERDTGEFVLVTAVAAAVCAGVIAWGAELLGVAPLKILSVAILMNNFMVAVVLGPPLVAALYPRARRWGLLYWQILGNEPVRRSARVTLGALLCWAGAAAVPIIGMSIPAEAAAGMAVVIRVAPAVAVMVAGALLI